jgi:putative alpha-1,2-mannosidase
LDFDNVSRAAENRWRGELSKLQIETADTDRKTIFYTALYHTILAPTLFDDVDGPYRGMREWADGTPSLDHSGRVE